MNDRTNAYADQDIREYFLECGNDLFFRKLNSFPFGQCWGFNVPSNADMMFAPMPWNRPNIRLLRSGGK